MGTVSNLLDGTPTLYLAPSGEALPEIDDITPPTITVTPAGNWVAQGFTVGDWDLNYEPTYEHQYVNEKTYLVKTVLVEEGASFMVKFIERDLLALSKAIQAATYATVSEGADQTGQTKLGVGGGTATAVTALLVGENPDGGSRLIHIPSCQAESPLKLSSTKKTHPEYDVTWTIIGDTTQSAGYNYFTIYDITTAASS